MSYGKHKVEHILQKTPSLSTVNGNTVLVGADGVTRRVDKTYDQYGRSEARSQAYEIPGYAGTPIDFADATLTVSGGASVLKQDIPGQGTGHGFSLVYHASGAVADAVLASAMAMDDLLMLTLNVERAEAASTPVTLKIYFLETAGDFVNYWWAYATITASGEQLISIPRGAINKFGTPTETKGCAQIRFRMEATTVNECPALPVGETVKVGALRKNPRTRAKIMFTHDDGKTPLETFAAKLAEYGWVGNAYIVPAVVGKTGYMTLAQLQTLKASGWVIGNHSYTHPANNRNDGIQLLGPKGQNIAVTTIDTATNIITCTTNLAPAGYAAPITFSAVAAPGGVTLGQDYYPKKVTVSTFTIHPTLDDAIAGTNTVDITSAGTTVTFSYSDATADETGIAADFQAAADWLDANGFDPWHCALPQASHDLYVHNALDGKPTVSVRGVYDNFKNTSKMDGTPLIYSYPDSTLGFYSATKTTTLPGSWMNLPGVESMESGLTATVQAFIDGLITTGATGCLLDHGYTEAVVTAVCDYVKEKEEAGLIDVVTAAEWVSGFNDKL